MAGLVVTILKTVRQRHLGSPQMPITLLWDLPFLRFPGLLEDLSRATQLSLAM
jgi:hypothetical protein